MKKDTFQIIYDPRLDKYCVVYTPTNQDVKCYKSVNFSEKKLKTLYEKWKFIKENNYRIIPKNDNTRQLLIQQYQSGSWINITHSKLIENAIRRCLEIIKEKNE